MLAAKATSNLVSSECGAQTSTRPCKNSLAALISFLLTVLLFGSSALAATYYVSPTGSDGNSGTVSAPFKTIQKAADIVNPGDTVIVKNGNYTDTNNDGAVLKINRAGTSGSWITFKAENRWGAVIDGQNAGKEGINLRTNAKYIRIENFEIKNATSAIISNDTVSANNIDIYGNHMHHTTLTGVYLAYVSNYFTIDSNIIHDVYGWR